MESNSMFVQDELGNEKEMEILFTFEGDSKKYVIFQDINDQSGEVFASAYNEVGELLPIESEAEWAMIEEVIQSFADEEDI